MEYPGIYKNIELLTGYNNPFDSSQIPCFYDLNQSELQFFREGSCSIPKSKRVNEILRAAAKEIGATNLTAQRTSAAIEAITEMKGKFALAGLDTLWTYPNILSSDNQNEQRTPRKLSVYCILDKLINFICERDGLEAPKPFGFGLALPNEVIQTRNCETNRILIPNQLEISPDKIILENGGIVITCGFEMACDIIWSRNPNSVIYKPAVGEPIDSIIAHCQTNCAIAIVEYEGGTEQEARDWLTILAQKNIILPVLIAELVQSGSSLKKVNFSTVLHFQMANYGVMRANPNFVSNQIGNIVKFTPSNRLVA